MGVWTQNDKFEDSTEQPKAEPTPKAEPEPAEETDETSEQEQKPKKKIKLSYKAIVFIGIGILIVFLWFLIKEQRKQDKPIMDNTAATDDLIDPTLGNDDDWLDEFVIKFQYTDDELSQLRAWGYTASEIENYQFNETPAQELIDSAREAQEAARASLANPESPEYKALLNDTWLGEPLITVPAYDPEVTPTTWEEVTYNADYVKCAPHGTNLFLKVTLENGHHHFMECSPFRYSALPPTGNIVVKYDHYVVDGVDFIYGMTEVEVK